MVGPGPGPGPSCSPLAGSSDPVGLRRGLALPCAPVPLRPDDIENNEGCSSRGGSSWKVGDGRQETGGQEGTRLGGQEGRRAGGQDGRKAERAGGQGRAKGGP